MVAFLGTETRQRVHVTLACEKMAEMSLAEPQPVPL
jgi:hypothetical protein